MDATTLESLRETLRGPVIGPQDPEYDQARTLYNAMIDKRPAAIARCADTADVMAAVNLVREAGAELSVRGGGHSGPGLSLVDGGVALDLSLMRWVRVDPETRTAQVGGGSQIGDLDHAAHGFGLGMPGGIMSTTGVGGLTLGGGHGHLTRKYGLMVDNLLAADVVLADGSFVTVNESTMPDLFWALRGGGGNFGVVTSLTYRLHPVDTVGVAFTLWPIDATRDVLEWYREFIPQAPEDLNGFFAVMVVPPEPPFPESIQLQKVCAVIWCYTGDPESLEQMLVGASEPGPPAFQFATPMPYPALQALFDGLIPKGLQWYWRGDFFDSITDDAIDVHLKHGSNIPTGLSMMHLYPVDGAAHRLGADDTAWSYRDAVWSGIVAGIDPDPANAQTIKEWCVNYWEELHPHSMGGSYVNFLGPEEGEDRVKSSYRGHYERLAQVKAEYDPGNLFHATQNVKPA